MRTNINKRLAGLLAVIAATMGLTAPSALAVTVTPNGTFTASGVVTFDGSIFGTITCNVAINGIVANGGTGSFSTTFSSCADPLATACTLSITTGSINTSINNGTGAYTVTSAESATMNDAPGGFVCGTDCTYSLRAGTFVGTINTTANDTIDATPTERLGWVWTSSTSNCNGSTITGSATIDTIAGKAQSLTITTA